MNAWPAALAAADQADPGRFRACFPQLGQRIHLASCSVAARSTELDAAIAQMLDDMTSGAAWELFEEQVAAARQGFARLIGARPDQVALQPSASVAAYQVASALDWTSRPVVVTSDAEFPSVAHVWLAQRPSGAQVRFADPAGYPAAIDERTKLVSVPLTTYRDGLRLPVPDIAAAAHSHGARVFVDAYQAVGTEPVNVDDLGCDYLVAGSMKYLLGLPGVAFLYVRSPEADHDPRLTGWFGRVNPFAFDPRRLDFPKRATRFETGTPAVPACYAANAGLSLIEQLDLAAVRKQIASLTARCAADLTALGEDMLVPPAPDAIGAHVCLRDPAPAQLVSWLAGRNITVSPRGEVIRLSFHYYNNGEDVAALCEEISRYRAQLARAIVKETSR
jgi:selenocysteine lyase/cysteine desulfurase